MFSARREVTRDELYQVQQLTTTRNPYRECGGWIHQNGKVELVEHWGICRKTIALHPHELPQDLKCLWISSPLMKPPGYTDECCDGCESENEKSPKLQQLRPPATTFSSRSLEEISKLEAFEKEHNPNHYVSEGQADWAKQMYEAGLPVSVLVYKQIGEKGVCDLYDPCPDLRKKAIGINLHPISELSGLGIGLKDPESLKNTQFVAIEKRKEAERQIYKAWLEFVTTEQICRDIKNDVNSRIQSLSEVWLDRHARAIERINSVQQLRDNYQASTWNNYQVRAIEPARKYQLQLPESLSVPISMELLNDVRFAPPIEAYQYINVVSSATRS
ncbi:MAG: hypothetical protein HC786_20430 [Richelia sp. CSU_2_1]|nr:hypothetical protein [Richelia sp. CSU_2_1]